MPDFHKILEREGDGDLFSVKGCVYFQSICDDKDAIEQLNIDIEGMKAEYDVEYVKSATDWVNLRDATNNNGYVEYYIDQALEAIQTLDEYQRLLTDKLELMVPNLFARYEASQNLSSEEYLDVLVGQVEINLKSIKEMVDKLAKSEMIGLMVQLLVERTLNSFTSSYKKAYNELRLYDKVDGSKKALLTSTFEADAADARILLDKNHPDYEKALKRHGLDSNKITRLDKFKMAPKVLSQMFSNSQKYAAKKWASLKEWGQIKSCSGFTAKVLKSLETPRKKMNAAKNFIFDSNSRKYTVKNFRMDWSAKIMTSLGAAVDIITQAVSVVEWSKVRDEMREARESYEDYKSALQAEIINVKEEQKNQSIEWGNIVETFKELTSAFDGLIQNASSYADFADVLGLPRLPVDSTNPMFDIDVDALDQTNVIPAQQAYIDFLKDNNNDLTVVNDEMEARDTLYSDVFEKTDQDEAVEDIHSGLRNIYKYSPSTTIRTFGTALAKKDIVCTCAVLRVDLDVYDHYSLVPFRPDCDVDDTTFIDMENEANADRNRVIMDEIVYAEVDGGSSASLSELLKTVQTAYSVSGDEELKAFGATLREQDIACSIATQFLDMEMYDYIDLAAFRPDCNTVTEQDFSEMQNEAENLRELDEKMENSMDICDSFSFCPCVSQLASQYSVTEGEVKASIKRVRPSLTEYCSTTGCSCVSL
ncbi:hypothetical protein FSP39_006850 [Pinctada imbricata]|uniref:Uncharacterized protein n=1 Tax=Pinctada imbricata TaxID=66713 RepID=A0AA88XVC6_PINIB|nr:hypothetical protein FSP39_006850 [Pinctada imbricata]